MPPTVRLCLWVYVCEWRVTNWSTGTHCSTYDCSVPPAWTTLGVQFQVLPGASESLRPSISLPKSLRLEVNLDCVYFGVFLLKLYWVSLSFITCHSAYLPVHIYFIFSCLWGGLLFALLAITHCKCTKNNYIPPCEAMALLKKLGGGDKRETFCVCFGIKCLLA